MSDLVVRRFNMVNVHSNGETYEDMREKPNGEFCRYREANFSHKEIINSIAESNAHNQGINNELLEALQEMVAIVKKHTYPQPDKPSSTWGRMEAAEAAIAKALGQ